MKRIAHRATVLGLPENSIAGLRALKRLHRDGVEIDLQASADGVLYAIHDAFVTVQGRRRRFTALTSREIAAAYELSAVPTLESLLDKLRNTTFEIVFDIKSHGVAGPLAAVLDDSSLRRRTLVMSFGHDHLRELRRLRTDVKLGLVIGWSRSATTISGALATVLGLLSPVAAARRFHCSVAIVPVWRTSRLLVDAAHRRKVDVYVWSRKILRDAPPGLDVNGALVDIEPG